MTLRRSALLLGSVGAVALVALAWSLRPKPGPAADARVAVWEAVPLEVEPLSAAGCSAGDRLVVQKLRRVGRVEKPGVPATCRYEFHLEGWPEGEDECILEFATESISGIETDSLAARWTTTYYQRRQGGIMTFAGPAEGRSFISLDARWCRSSSVVEGLHAVP